MFNTEKINRLLRNHEAVDYYSIKPVNAESATGTLYGLLTGSMGKQREEKVQRVDSYPSGGLDLVVEDYLRKLGLGTAMLHTKCARVAIEMCLEVHKDSRINMMRLYEQVGLRFNPILSVSAVERNIRSAMIKARETRTPLFDQCFAELGSSFNNSLFVQESANLLRRRIVENSDDKILVREDSAFFSKWR
jgi:hypothetical protein